MILYFVPPGPVDIASRAIRVDREWHYSVLRRDNVAHTVKNTLTGLATSLLKDVDMMETNE